MKKKKPNKIIRVVELFAGVGGFRIGLEGYGKKKLNNYRTVWSNQWEPATKKQHASEVYVSRFGPKNHSNQDIKTVETSQIPNHDLLVGGFPCQDYSVARNLSAAEGIVGKKGVLWWEIYRILKEKGKNAPNFLILENVDRLLKSPAKQRGRDFAIMSSSLNDLGYIIEWRVINAADYGMPQRRRRIFVIGYKKGSLPYKKIDKRIKPLKWLSKNGTLAKAFPIKSPIESDSFYIEGSLEKISSDFNKGKPKTSPFLTAGVSIRRKIFTFKATPNHKGGYVTLGDILQKNSEVPESFYIRKKDLPRWKYLKGSKKEERKSRDGFKFFYIEGPMLFPDDLTKASRTIVTGEGGSTPSRFKHVIKTLKGFRRLTPIELERLCMFPDNHTIGQTNSKRAFFMGNALVVGVVEKIGRALLKQIEG